MYKWILFTLFHNNTSSDAYCFLVVNWLVVVFLFADVVHGVRCIRRFLNVLKSHCSMLVEQANVLISIAIISEKEWEKHSFIYITFFHFAVTAASFDRVCCLVWISILRIKQMCCLNIGWHSIWVSRARMPHKSTLYRFDWSSGYLLPECW